MRLAIFSDVHANLEALSAVLEAYRSERIDKHLQELCAEFDVPLIDARDWIEDAHFTDSHHLLRRGAEIFSERLAREEIAKWLR